jgi:hypothetical protein
MPGPAIEPKLLGELAVVIIKAVSTPNLHLAQTS